MWLVLVLVLCACGGSTPVAVENRGGTASTSCDVPARLDLEARRYANLDADQAGYQTWSAWRVGIQLTSSKPPRGVLAMVGDELVWSFDFAGRVDDHGCALELWTDTHDPIRVNVDLRTRTGRIASIDDVWLLGPPFPTRR
jgi:hypothetical protein